MHKSGDIINGIELLEKINRGKWIGRCVTCYAMRIHRVDAIQARKGEKCSECPRGPRVRAREKEMRSIDDNPMLIWLKRLWK